MRPLRRLGANNPAIGDTSLPAREEEPDEDSFCSWCHHRDEREARKFIRDALKTTPRPM
jgi:hypothetical protein